MSNEFFKSLTNLQNAINNAIDKKIDLSDSYNETKALSNFGEQKKIYLQKMVTSSIKSLRNTSVELNNLVTFDPANSNAVKRILDYVSKLKSENLEDLKKIVDKITGVSMMLNLPKDSKSASSDNSMFSIPSNLPAEIKGEIIADINEMEKCYNSNCFRSSVILCGRVLEAILHRKYYDTTGQDILEKNPGIGLGKLIAKLGEKDVKFDPGLTQQIHLINNVRIFSVHKKQDVFYPSKEQTQAIILFTLDIIRKVFV